MADAVIGDVNVGFTNRAKLQGGQTAALSSPGNYGSLASMITRLQAINAGYFTTARIRTMTVNDLTYALRLADDPTTI